MFAVGGRDAVPPMLAYGLRRRQEMACTTVAVEELKVCRLPAGGNWIRNSSSALSSVVSWVSEIRNPGIRDGSHRSSPRPLRGANPVLGSAASARAPQPLTTAFRNTLAVDGAAPVDLDGTFRKYKGAGSRKRSPN